MNARQVGYWNLPGERAVDRAFLRKTTHRILAEQEVVPKNFSCRPVRRIANERWRRTVCSRPRVSSHDPTSTAPYRRVDADHAMHGARRFSADAMSPWSPRSAHKTRLNATTPRTILVNRSERLWLKPHSVILRMREFSQSRSARKVDNCVRAVEIRRDEMPEA